MLILTRKMEESITVGDNIEIKVLEIHGGQVRIGISAPRQIPVHRKEIYERIAGMVGKEAIAEAGEASAVL